MTTTYTQNRLTIEKRALRRLGVTNPSATELANTTEAFQALIKKLSALAPWIWNISNTASSFSTVAAQRTYSAASSEIAIDIWDIEHIEIDRGGTYQPIDLIDKTDSLTTYEREGTGEPYLAYFERATLPGSSKLHLFPTPSAVLTINYTYQKVMSDIGNTTDSVDFPQAALTDLSILLAADIADEYGAPNLGDWVSRAQLAQRDIITLNYQNIKKKTVTSEYF